MPQYPKFKSNNSHLAGYSKLIIAYLMLMHLVLIFMAVYIVKPELVQRSLVAVKNVGAPFLTQSAASGGANSFKPTDHYKAMLAFQLRADPLRPENLVIFLGDSLTQSLPVELVTDNALNYGIGTDDTVGLRERIKLYESVPKAKALILAVGVNDLLYRNDDALMQSYNQLLEQLPPGPSILCSLILPIEEVIRNEWNGRSNVRIRAVNARIKEACEARGYTIIEATDVMAGADGELIADYHDGDGLHLSALGYAAWVGVLQSAVLDVLE